VKCLALIVFGLIWAVPALAASISERPNKVTLTIYQPETMNTVDITNPADAEYYRREGIAFITESRSMDLPAGPVQIEFRGVMSTIVPQTAEITGLPSGVLERNFDYDLLSPGSLLAKSIGQTVRLERTDPNTGKRTEQSAIVRAAPSGVVLEINGKFEALHCSGLPERLIFEKVPDGLRDTPTLSVRAVMSRAGHYTLTLSYIATGLFWSADYNAHVRPDGRSLDLSGWITLTNLSDSNYRRVPVELVAGRVFTAYVDEPVAPQTPKLNNDCWPTEIDWATLRRVMDKFSGLPPPPPPPPPSPASADKSVETVVVTGSRIPDPRQLGDYKLYRLPEPTNFASHQSKQVQFLQQTKVPFERIYTYAVDRYGATSEDVAATAMLRLHNDTADGLGKPLPNGTVSVTESAPGGIPVLAGQDNIHDTPSGLPVEIATGRALDVRVVLRQSSSQSQGSGRNTRTRKSYEITIENDKRIPIQFELGQPVLDGARILDEDQPHAVKPNGMIWSFAMAPHERKVMHYTVELSE
jgi:hypothetical protein